MPSQSSPSSRAPRKKVHRLRIRYDPRLRIPKENVLDLRTKGDSKTPLLSPKPASFLKRFPSFRLHLPSISWSTGSIRSVVLFGRRSVRPLAAFAVVSLLFMIPIYAVATVEKANEVRGRVLGISTVAVEHFKSAGTAAQALRFEEAQQEFTFSLEAFRKAQDELHRIHRFLEFVPGKGGEFADGRRTLEAGEALASAGQYLSRAFDILESKGSFGFAETKLSPVEALLLVDASVRPALSTLNHAHRILERISMNHFPPSVREEILFVQKKLPLLVSTGREWTSMSGFFLKILGNDVPRRYLLVFQNNAEMRPTGGFIGSFALVSFDKGRMKELEIPGGGSYDLQGWLEEKVSSPKPLHLVNPHWQFQDGNWFPDFPSSAKKLIWFFTKSGGPSVDGVIAITPDVLEALLEISGPIDLTKEKGIVVSHENVREVLENEVQKMKETKEPKKIIGTLTPLILENLMRSDVAKGMITLGKLRELLLEKFFLFYFEDPELEQFVLERGWGGEMKETPQDYLSVIHTNIAGGKTDRFMEELMDRHLVIAEDGRAESTVTVTRVHKGKEGDSISGIKNIDFFRVYVPKGSRLVRAEGFEEMDPKKFLFPEEGYRVDTDLMELEKNVVIDEGSGTRISEEFGKTVFGNWVGTEVGKSSKISFTYELPFRITLKGWLPKKTSYRFLFQKQPGISGSVMTNTIEFPKTWKVLEQYPTASFLEASEGILRWSDVLKTDLLSGLVFQKS